MSNSTSYKQRKEDFVSNLTGGSVEEILSVTSVAPVSLSPEDFEKIEDCLSGNYC